MYLTDSARAPMSPNNGYNENRIKINIQPSDVSAGIGAFVNLSAVIRAAKPSFQWFNSKGQKIAGKRESNLFLGPLRKEDFGFYRLQIVDEVLGTAELSRWVEIRNANLLTLLEAPKGGAFQRGSTINLCGHFANAVYYQWYMNGTMLERCTDNTLVINHCDFHNTGDYVLMAANEANEMVQVSVSVHIY